MTEVTRTLENIHPMDDDDDDDDSQSIPTTVLSESGDVQNTNNTETKKIFPEETIESAELETSIDFIDRSEELIIDEKEELIPCDPQVANLENSRSPSECGQGDGHARASTSAARAPSPELSVYHVKWIKWKENKTAIITQNENGPCPLIAIMNLLILKGRVQLPSMIEMITAEQLVEYLGDTIFHYAPKNISEDTQLNYEQNMADAMAIVPKLQTGLDVNVKFTGVSDFEYTPECIIFDLLNIQLFHGWLVDPQNEDVVFAVGNLSYNQLVEKIITDKASTNSDVVTVALIAESFLERTASQLTYHGLCELNTALKKDELGNELFQLVTDQGFLTESNVVWETLSNIDGDGQFVDCHFVTVPPKASSCTMLPSLVPSEQQIDQDYLVALSLQDDQRRQEEQEVAWKEYKEKQLGVCEAVTDEELARRLQQEERDAQADDAARSPPATVSSTTERPVEPKKKNDCIIL
uniref:Ubiquitin carboxyl-terminal hydrolase n=1 Tax=Strigamia maritima TaxID=126957 RepID=T1J1K6_STRMM